MFDNLTESTKVQNNSNVSLEIFKEPETKNQKITNVFEYFQM